jgi:hypothetical protein
MLGWELGLPVWGRFNQDTGCQRAKPSVARPQPSPAALRHPRSEAGANRCRTIDRWARTERCKDLVRGTVSCALAVKVSSTT